MKTIFASILIALTLPALSSAQSIPFDKLTPSLPTAGERRAADAASWATAVAAIALDAKVSWDSPNRARAFSFQAARLGATYGVAAVVKKMVARQRPCASLQEGCGIDDDFSSFYSAHTAVAFQAIGGPRLAIALPLALGTGGLRIAAGKHWLTDTMVGAAAGLLTSRIR